MELYKMHEAIVEAEEALAKADSVAQILARLLVGRLRKVNRSHLLKALKVELRDYNARTGRWKQ